MKEIQLTQGKVALVDDEDYEYLNQFKWYFHGFYAKASIRSHNVYMHREIMRPPESSPIDHINENKLDNRKQNLRVCDKSENTQNIKRLKRNTSGYKGVFWNKPNKNWNVQITKNHKRFHLGVFDNILNAARAYDEMAIKLYGKYANVNFSADE